MPSRPLTEEQKGDAKRLRLLYDRWKIKNPETGPQDQIGPAHGMSQSAFSQRLNGSLSLTPESAVAFAKLLGCAVSDFSPSLARRIASLSPTPARDVALAAGEDYPPYSMRRTGSFLKANDRNIDIPFLDSRASMGNGIALTDYVNVVEMVSANRDELAKRCTFTSPANLRLLTAYGNSMSPTFRDGDVLLVDTGMTELTVDHVYVLQRDDELFIKRITRNPVDRTLFVMSSDNRDHPPFEIRPERDGFKVLAKVVSVWNFREL